MIRINLAGTYGDAAEPTRAWHLPYYALGIVLLTAGYLAFARHAATLTDVRDALRLEIARRQAAILRGAAKLSIPEDTDDRSAVQDLGARLRRVAGAMPPDLWLVAYSEQNGEMALRGRTLNEDAPRVLVENLAATSVFRRVEIIETARAPDPEGEQKDAVLEFQLKAALHREPTTVDDEGLE